MIYSKEEKINIIKINSQVNKWVNFARRNHTTLNALVNGIDFVKVLIERIEKIESKDKWIARERYSKDIRDVWARATQPRDNIFTAFGGATHISPDLSDNKKKALAVHLKNFKGQKSIKKYLSETYFQLQDSDPNGVMFLEYKDNTDIYPTYKSINHIRDYVSNGQLCEYILFEPIKFDNFSLWRFVDDQTDSIIKQVGDSYELVEEIIVNGVTYRSFNHSFGVVPCIIIGESQVVGTEIRHSYINKVEELGKEHARDKSVKTIYKFQHGFPRHFRYVKECKACRGTGKTGESPCQSCSGKGETRRNDVTDTLTMPFPREGQPMVSELEGFISPDLETWERYNNDLSDLEDSIDSTLWGTRRMKESTNETATGRWIDVQPVENALTKGTDNIEWVHNTIIGWVENWLNGSPTDQKYRVSYGRHYIIESSSTILEKYLDSKEKGANNSILDKLLNEYVVSKYQNDPVSLMEMEKKVKVEPYVHYSVDTVYNIFGREEAQKKQLFHDFWENVDITKTTDQLKIEFEKYTQDNLITVTNNDNNNE